MKGKVVRFNSDKGYGFIKSEDGKDIFFHYSALMVKGFKTIEPNTEVEFDVEQSEKGLRASNIKLVA
jgi:cold shock protein